MSACLLSPPELCDLLNYLLGLPERLGKRTVLRPAIHSCVITSWKIKPQRRAAESWCDARLLEAGIGPVARSKYTGRPGGRSLPREVSPWLPTTFRRVA